MDWVAWILLSAVVLALYDLAKKASVRNNAVLPVLLCSTLCGAAAFVGGLAASGRFGAVLASVDGRAVGFAASKSLIVSASWIFTFQALRTLPITIATPIRASAPALVILAWGTEGQVCIASRGKMTKLCLEAIFERKRR